MLSVSQFSFTFIATILQTVFLPKSESKQLVVKRMHSSDKSESVVTTHGEQGCEHLYRASGDLLFLLLMV